MNIFFRAVSITGAAKSLDILREVMQNAINSEIQTIVDGYINTYFRPALENIRENSGPNTVNEEYIQCMCRKILEEVGVVNAVSPSILATHDGSHNCIDICFIIS